MAAAPAAVGVPAPAPMRQFVYTLSPSGVPWNEYVALFDVDPAGVNTFSYVVFDPDGQIKVMELSVPPLAEVRWGSVRFELPAGLGRAHGQPVRRFARAPTLDVLGQAQRDAIPIIDAHRAALGLPAFVWPDAAPVLPVIPHAHTGMPAPAPPMGPAATAMLSVPVLAVDEVATVVLAGGADAFGSSLTPRAGDTRCGEMLIRPGLSGTTVAVIASAAASVGKLQGYSQALSKAVGTVTPAEPPEDIRTLATRFEASGERYRNFDSAAMLMTTEEMGSESWPLEGARTCLWWYKATRRLGLTPISRHNTWTSESGVSPTDRSVYEHEVLSTALEYFATIDQLNVPNLVGAEYLLRRLQLIEEAHLANPAQPSYEGSEHWMGTGRRKGGVLINPELTKHAAGKVKDEMAVAKERRLAREERRLQPKGSGKKNKSKKDDDDE